MPQGLALGPLLYACYVLSVHCVWFGKFRILAQHLDSSCCLVTVEWSDREVAYTGQGKVKRTD